MAKPVLVAFGHCGKSNNQCGASNACMLFIYKVVQDEGYKKYLALVL